MKKNIIAIIIVSVLVLFVVLNASFYILPEGRQAIITEFGKPVSEPITEAGIKFKVPFVQEVRFVDKRILYWDGDPNQIPTKDKKYIKVDTTARWQIIDVLKFIQTVQNETSALARLDSIIDSATRDVISNHNLVEAVRDSNTIVKKSEERKKLIESQKAEGQTFVDEDVSGEIEPVETGRESLSRLIVEKADAELAPYGIKIIDVQLRRISYERSVEAKVYERMISERQKIAQKIRSIGQGEKARIEGRLIRDLKRIESEAYRQSQEVRGKADNKTISIYAQTLSLDPDFYSFMRSLEAYKKALPERAKFLLSHENEFFKYLKSKK